jgi:hypothetical protein
MAVGAQDVGEQVGIARIALATGGTVPRPAGFDDIRMDGDDRVARLDQRLDDQARGALNGNRDGRGRSDLVQAAAQFGQPFGRVVDGKAGDDVAICVIDDADGMDAATPVHSATIAHARSPVVRDGVPFAGRSCGKLIDRRSGLAFRGATPCGPLGPPGACHAAGLMRAEKPAS